jgi:virginiamycin B lyase
VTLALAGCNGNGGSIPNVQPALGGGAASVRERVKAHVHIFVPRAPRHAHGRQLRPFFVATSTAGVSIAVYRHGSGTPESTTNVPIGPTSTLCQAVTGGRSCTVPAPAPVGSDDFVIKTYDGYPVGGSFSGSHQLAVGKTTATIAKGRDNFLYLTLGGVVAKSLVALASPAIPAIDNNSQTVTVNALDADVNTIIGGWYDADGNPVTMTLSTPSISPVVLHFSTTTVSFNANTSTMTYTSSQASSTQIKLGIVVSVNATPSNGTTVGFATLTMAAPSITEFPVATAFSYPTGIVVGPDNAIWFAECLGNKIGRITTSATAGTQPQEFSTGMHANANPTTLAVAPDDHKIWFTENSNSSVASIDPTTDTINEYATKTASSSPYGITAGPDGNMWFTENALSNIGKFNATAEDNGVGMIQEYPTKTSGGPERIAAGPDGKLWFTEQASPPNDVIGTIKTDGTGANDYALPANSIGDGSITTGPDGALWFSEGNQNSGEAIGRITTGGSVTIPLTFPHSPYTSPQGIVTGPDGALWFVESCANKIGRIDPSTHGLVEFTVTGSNLQLWDIVKGPDGALWFTENAGNKIGKLQ